jgi:hypothetical protein
MRFNNSRLLLELRLARRCLDLFALSYLIALGGFLSQSGLDQIFGLKNETSRTTDLVVICMY